MPTPPYMLRAIASAADADAFIRALIADGKDFHFDDTPDEVVNGAGAPVFTVEEAAAVGQRVDEVRALPDYDPFALALFLTNRPDSFVALDAAMMALYGEGLNAEQRDCLDDPARRDEARDMLDDMEARMSLPAAVVAAVLADFDNGQADLYA